MSMRRHPDAVPEEVFMGRKQGVSHLCVFGSRCSAGVLMVNGQCVDGLSKLDGRGIPATLIGYGSGAGNYILLDEHGV